MSVDQSANLLMTGSRTSATTIFHSTIVLTVPNVMAANPDSFVLGSRGCRRRIAGLTGLNMLEQVE